jgi:hypothetical protein
MAFTAQLGINDAAPGNVVPGLAPLPGDLVLDQVAVELLTGAAVASTVIEQLAVEVLTRPSIASYIDHVAIEVLVPFSALPPEAEFPSDVIGILIWIEWSHVDGSGNPQTLVFAKIPLADRADYYGGWKDSRVTVWGRYRRALSDHRGQYEVASLSWSLADTDRLLRGMLADPVMRYFQNRTVAMRMISDEGRRLRQTPRLIARGIIRNCKPTAPLLMAFTAEDFLSSVFSTMNFEKQIPQRVVGSADFPTIASTVLQHPVPILYGHLTDALSQAALVGPGGDLWWVSDPLTGSYFFDTGAEYFAGFGHQMSDCAAPENVVVTVNAASGTVSMDVPNSEYAFMVVAIDEHGNYSDPCPFFWGQSSEGRGSFYSGPILTVPTATLTDSTSSITVSWDAVPGAVAYRCYMAFYYFTAKPVQALETAGLSVTFTTNPAWFTSGDLTPNQVAIHDVWRLYTVTAEMSDGATTPLREASVGSHPFRRTMRLEWTAVPGALGYHVWRHTQFSTVYTRWDVAAGVLFFEDDLVRSDGTEVIGLPVSKGVVPPVVVGTTDIGGMPWTTLLLAGHACRDVEEWFIDGVKVDPATAGVTWLVPGKAGWPYATLADAHPYVDINGHRYTVVYVRGPDGDAILAGTRQVTFNVQGIESQGDGTGTLIENLHDQYLHACRNWLFQSYLTGDWLTSPNWPADVNGTVMTQIDEPSFTAVKAIVAARLPQGYLGAWALGCEADQVPLRDVLAMLNTNAGVESGFNRYSQFFVSMLDPDVDLAAAERFTQAIDIDAKTFVIDDLVTDLYNRLPYAYRRDYAGNTWLIESAEEDAASIAGYQETRSDAELELWCVRDAATMTDLVVQHLARTNEPPRRVRFVTTLRGLTVELGDVITIDHIEGIGATGWTQYPVRVLRHEFDPETLAVRLECEDVARLLAP